MTVAIIHTHVLLRIIIWGYFWLLLGLNEWWQMSGVIVTEILKDLERER
jgi:hypothetical protein